MSTALVVLGAAVWPGETPSPTLQRRVNKAIEAWKTEGYDLVVASGGLGRNPPSEAEMMHRLMVEGGVPAHAILLEDRSTSTLTNAMHTGELLRDRGITRAGVVTDDYHCLRAALTFRHVGLEVHMIPATGCSPRQRWQVSLRQWLREALALPVYLFRLYLGASRRW